VAEKIADIYADISANTGKFDSKIARSHKKLGGFTSALMKAASLAATFIGIRALGRFGKSAIDASARLEEAGNKFDVVFGKNAEVVREWSKSLENSFGGTQTEIESWLSSVQDILVPMGLARDKAANLSKTIVTLAGDLGSFQDKKTGDVLNNMTSVMMGMHRAGYSLGIVIKAAEVEMKAMGMTGKKTAKDLTETDKMLARIALMSEKSKDAQGDWIRTMDSLANRMKILSKSWGDFVTVLGTSIRQLFDVKQLVSDTGDGLQDMTAHLTKLNESGWFIKLSENLKAAMKVIKVVAVPALAIMGAILLSNALRAIAMSVAIGNFASAAAASAILATAAIAGTQLTLGGKFEEIMSERDANIKRRMGELKKDTAEDAATVAAGEDEKQAAIKKTQALQTVGFKDLVKIAQEGVFGDKSKPGAMVGATGTPPRSSVEMKMLDEELKAYKQREAMKKNLRELIGAIKDDRPLPAMG